MKAGRGARGEWEWGMGVGNWSGEWGEVARRRWRGEFGNYEWEVRRIGRIGEGSVEISESVNLGQ